VVAAVMEKYAFRNLPMAALCFLGVVAGRLVAALSSREKNDLIGFSICIYSAYVASIYYMGVVIAGNKIHFPLPIIPLFPFIVVGRFSVSTNDIMNVKSLGNWYGFQAIDIQTGTSWRILFADSEKRRGFLKALIAIRPDLYVYRSRRV
jgi:hypothetical protein